MYATDRQTLSDVRRASSHNASALWGHGHNNPVRSADVIEFAQLRRAVCQRQLSFLSQNSVERYVAHKPRKKRVYFGGNLDHVVYGYGRVKVGRDMFHVISVRSCYG